MGNTTIEKVFSTLGGNDALREPNAQLYADLTRVAQGQFTGTENTAMFFFGIDKGSVQRMAVTCKHLTDTEFKGDAHAAMSFLQRVQQNPSMKKLDFNELVNDGAAHRMIQMSRTDPKGFGQVLQGSYLTPASLLARLTPPPGPAATQPAPATTRPAAGPAPRPMS